MKSDSWSTHFDDEQEVAKLEAAADGADFLDMRNVPHGSEASGQSDSHVLQIQGFRIHERLGSGGSSVVYRATRVDDSSQQFAIKILTESVLNADYLMRFRRETKLLSELNHPNIAQLHDFGVARGGQPYLVLQYIDGDRIDRYCHDRKLTLDERVRLLIKVCLALHYAHEQGVLHRDLKPNNILVSQDGVPHLTDFGLAKRAESLDADSEQTRTGTVMGTLNYLAPEQIFSIKSQTSRTTDVFGLGGTLHALLTGRPPLDFCNFVDAARDYFKKLPVEIKSPNNIPSDLEAICIKCLAPNPTDRYPTAQELADELRRFLGGESVSARSKKLFRKVSLLNRQYPWLMKVSLSYVMITAVAMTSFFMLWRSSEQSLREAEESRSDLKQILINQSDRIRSHEDSPESLAFRRKALEFICDDYEALSHRFESEPDLLLASAVAEFKLGRVEHHLGNREAQRERYETARRKFQEFVQIDPSNEEARFGLFHALTSLRQLDEAQSVIADLAREYPDNLDYADAYCSITLQIGQRLINDDDVEAARPYLEEGERLAIALQPHVNTKPRFRRKLVCAKAQKSRLLILAGELEQAQHEMSEALEEYKQIRPLSSNVESESWEYLEDLSFAISIAAYRDDAALVEKLAATSKDFGKLAIDRYPGVVAIYQVQCIVFEELATYYSQTSQVEAEAKVLAAWRENLDQWNANARRNRDYWRSLLAYACSLRGEAFDRELLATTLDQCRKLHPDDFPGQFLGRGYFLLGDLDLAKAAFHDSKPPSYHSVIDQAYRDAIERAESASPLPRPQATPSIQDEYRVLAMSRSYAKTSMAQRSSRDFDRVGYAANVAAQQE